jgi:plasmid stabilization system protein ParE
MSSFALTPLAKADIFQIWIYISEDSEEAANRVERAIYDACAFVAEGPLPRAGQHPPTRFGWPQNGDRHSIPLDDDLFARLHAIHDGFDIPNEFRFRQMYDSHSLYQRGGKTQKR